MKQIRKQFPVLNHSIYANTAATGLLYDDLLEWRQEHDLDYLIGGSEMKMHSNKMHSETRKIVGNFFNCQPDNVALVPNFTIGLNFLVEGLNRREKVLLVEGDYPSLNWPFESRGFNIAYVPVSENFEEEIFSAIKTKGITVLALSVVQWLNGIMIDLSFLKKLKAEFKDLLIISDGTQFLGTQEFNFFESGVDIIGASAYKWLLSGFGNGLILVKDEIKERFSLVAKGFGSGRNSIEFDENIENHNTRLSQKAKIAFENLGLLDEVSSSRESHSTIFNIKGDKQVFEELIRNEVVCVQRGDGIRISFHFYNTLDEVNEIVKILKKVV